MMPNPIIACGIDSPTMQGLAERGLFLVDGDQGALPRLVRQFPEAVLLTEGVSDGTDAYDFVAGRRTPLKVIRIIDSDEPQPDYGEALKSHLYGVFTRPLDFDSLAEAIEDAQQLRVWSDGIEVISARPDWLTLRVRCRRFTAERLVRFVRELAAGLNSEEREQIGTAFREILLNGMEHGAAFDASKTVHVSCLRTTRFLMYTVRDPGPGFSLENLPHAALSNPPDKPGQHLLYRAQKGIRAGGFGLMIAQEMVDEMIYNEAGNEVALIKYLNVQKPE